ncbi:Flp pilus assembly protein TadG [Tepidicaulis marinus]|uniref:Flp pilus assembly protein TadG n=1 Tax=Tepidicaulis marinus TaxID=1333998 RepID=A0A081BBC2_9HYPH|nr:pilus assembly protein [Tepidicaulis marinus]GAK45340.1 Flp pilus assembly protein TadG [Tepidicaulis marinus]
MRSFASTYARPFKRLRRFCGTFRKASRGNVAIIFALALVPVLAGIAGAIDFSRAYIVRERLTSALDAAGLAIGSLPEGLSQEELQQRASKFFEANYPAYELGVPGELQVTESDGHIYLTANASLPTALLNILGIDVLDIDAQVRIVRESSKIELVMVLDNTGSMSGSRLSALKTSAAEMVNILFGDETNPDHVKVGLVPFAAAVNVGSDKINAPWIDRNAQSSIHGENFIPGTNIFDLYDDIRNRDWNGCLETRPAPLDETDATPVATDGDTLFVPWFAPDEPDRESWWDPRYPNDYLDDEHNGDPEERQADTKKYENAWVSSSSRGPQNGCNVRTITPLTNDKNRLLNEIDDMIADGMTHIPLGLAWGWRVISPTSPYTEGASYGDRDYKKAIILLTDGENTIPGQGWGNINGSSYTAYGYLSKQRLGTSSSSQAAQELDEKTLRICNNVKQANIRLYTITFQVSSSSTRNMMRSCATSPSMYYDSPSISTLQEVFQQIAGELNALRIAE